MSELEAKVARAMWDEACPGMLWGTLDEAFYLSMARSAIEAIDAAGYAITLKLLLPFPDASGSTK